MIGFNTPPEHSEEEISQRIHWLLIIITSISTTNFSKVGRWEIKRIKAQKHIRQTQITFNNIRTQASWNFPTCPSQLRTTLSFNSYLRATAKSLDKVKRSVLLLGKMAAKMSVNRPEEGEEEESDHRKQQVNFSLSWRDSSGFWRGVVRGIYHGLNITYSTGVLNKSLPHTPLSV